MNKYKLKDICTKIYSGGTPSTKEPKYWGGNIPWLSSSESGKDFIYETDNYISNLALKETSTKYVSKNTVIIATAGEGKTRGQVSYLKIGACINQSLIALETDAKKVDSLFLYYYLKNSYSRIRSLSNATGIRGSLSGARLKELIVFIPDVSEQLKISDLLYKLDLKIQNNKKQIEILETLAKTIYDYWFVQFDFPNEEGKPYKSSGGKMVWNEELKREIPEGWNVGLFDEYCKIFTGKKDVKQSLGSGKYKFYSCAPDHKYSNDKLYEGKAILISGNGSYTGRTIFVEEAFDLYQRTYACVDKTENSIIEYLYLTILKFFVPIIQGGTHGSAIPYIVYNDIAKIRFAMNKDVIEKFQNKAVKILKKINNKKKENLELNSLRLFLLPFLMNGQVKV